MIREKKVQASAYIVRNNDTKILNRSTSGGFFYGICQYVITKGGIVFGAGFNDDLSVGHKSAKTLEECIQFLGSKYVQSSIRDVFSEVEMYLKNGKLVCFSGTPCQVSGLKSYLKIEYDNLISVDLVCHGILPEKMWKQYCAYQEREHNSSILSASFRSKKYGYQNSMMNLNFYDQSYFGSSRIDPYLKTFYSNIALRPSCYECKFKGVDRVSDFTIYDCWNAHSILGIKDDDAGYTNVIAHTDHAIAIMSSIQGIEKHLVELECIVPSTGGMITKSAKMNPNMTAFMKLYVEEGFEKAFSKYLPVTLKDRCIEFVKIRLRNIAGFRRISKLKRELARKNK